LTRVLGSAWTYLAAFLVVVGAVLWLAPTSSTPADRIANLESLVKCPVCDDLSVAQSNEASSLLVRATITADVDQGESDTTILTSLEAKYGPSILLSPRGSDLDDLLFATPVAVVVVGLATYARLARQRR
jgi:cytochrome c-type biogenesis protein CcmH